VDSTTQALNYLRGDSGGHGVLELLKQSWDGFVDTWRTFDKARAQAIEAPGSAQITVEVWKKYRSATTESLALACPPDLTSG
jgi:hypothetical protein